jgi:hypothetical protein
MKVSSLGNWTKGARLTIRLTGGLRDTLATGAAEERRIVAEIATAVLTAWAVEFASPTMKQLAFLQQITAARSGERG